MPHHNPAPKKHIHSCPTCWPVREHADRLNHRAYGIDVVAPKRQYSFQRGKVQRREERLAKAQKESRHIQSWLTWTQLRLRQKEAALKDVSRKYEALKRNQQHWKRARNVEAKYEKLKMIHAASLAALKGALKEISRPWG